jgi:seryl-tRNA(Sec) selenium transferase
MRALTLGVALTAVLATTAFAQTDFEAQHHMLQARSQGFAAPGSPLAGLTKASRDWIEARTKQQIAEPLTVDKLAMEIDLALHEDEVRVARQRHLNTLDIVRAITLQITREADKAAASALKAAQGSADATAIKVASERDAVASANLKAAISVQTDASMELAGL